MSAYIHRMTYENMDEAPFKCKSFFLCIYFLKRGMHQYLVGTLGGFKCFNFAVPLEECSIYYCVPFSYSYFK